MPHSPHFVARLSLEHCERVNVADSEALPDLLRLAPLLLRALGLPSRVLLVDQPDLLQEDGLVLVQAAALEALSNFRGLRNSPAPYRRQGTMCVRRGLEGVALLVLGNSVAREGRLVELARMADHGTFR